ncbi:hypothetical protein [Microbacterium sp. gxy059]|uniref:hypothetical protein n=1 Tax=Microbacterium sp. gxy059 TaxID=2957199 RepID=UPI003D9804F2
MSNPNSTVRVQRPAPRAATMHVALPTVLDVNAEQSAHYATVANSTTCRPDAYPEEDDA